MERNTPDGVCAWLSEEFSRPGWHSARVAQELSNEVLEMVLMRYEQYHQCAKLGVLFALLHIRKSELVRMQHTMQKFFARAAEDTDDWVKMTARILKDVPTARKLHMDIESWSEPFGALLTDISQVVKTKGISFHACETAVLMEEARDHCVYGTEAYNSNKPTLKQHFRLKTPASESAATKHRKQMLQAILEREQADRQPTPISPTTPTTRPLSSPVSGAPPAKRQAVSAPQGGLFVPRQRPVRPPPARPAPGASSLFNTGPKTRPPMARPPSQGTGASSSSMFIPSRKNSLGAPRPPAIRTALPHTAAPVTTPTTPKGFQKQSRVQMLDFTESSKMLQDNNRNIDEAEKNLKAQKEQQKHENALRRQAQREEEARWKASARATKRPRTDSTSREESSEPSSPRASKSPGSASPPPIDHNDENLLQDPTHQHDEPHALSST